MPSVRVKDAVDAIRYMSADQLSVLADRLVQEYGDKASVLSTYIEYGLQDQFMIEQYEDQDHGRHYVPDRG